VNRVDREQSLQAHRDDRDAESSSHEADTWLERQQFARLGARSFGIDANAVARVDEFAGVAQSAAGTAEPLWQRVGVEERERQRISASFFESLLKCWASLAEKSREEV
jgi:hypothetical protein